MDDEILAYVEFIPDVSAHLIALGVFVFVLYLERNC